jgi:hypothetical protein
VTLLRATKEKRNPVQNAEMSDRCGGLGRRSREGQGNPRDVPASQCCIDSGTSPDKSMLPVMAAPIVPPSAIRFSPVM